MRSSSLKYLHSLSKQIWRGKCTEEEDGIEGGARCSKDDEAVQLLRDSLLLDGPIPSKLCDYYTLLRFLRKRDYDTAKAKDSFLKYLKWREEFGVDAIFAEFEFEEYKEVQEYYPHGYHGVDRFGRPVYIEKMGMVDLDALLRVTTLERLVKHHVYEQEKTARLRFPACTIAVRKRIASTTAILDVKGLGASSFTKSARYLFTEFQNIASNYYPETLNCLFIINAGSSFKILWKALKTFLDAHTSAKIQVLGSNFRSKLIEVIEPSNLPAFLGGECTCSCQGGCLLSDKGPWNNREISEQLESIKIKDDGVFTTIEETSLSAQSTPDLRNVQSRKNGANTDLLKDINQLEVTAKEAKNKIRTVEAALEDAKQVLDSFSQQINDLKVNLKNSAELGRSLDLLRKPCFSSV